MAIFSEGIVVPLCYSMTGVAPRLEPSEQAGSFLSCLARSGCAPRVHVDAPSPKEKRRLVSTPCRYRDAGSNDVPGLAGLPPQELGSFGVADDFLSLGVPANLAAHKIRNVREVGDDAGAMPNLHICRRLFPRTNAVDEILEVQTCRVLGRSFFSFHPETLRRRARAGAARSRGRLRLRINFKPQPVGKQRAAGPVERFSVRAVVRAARLVVLLAGGSPASRVRIKHARLGTRHKIWIFECDLQDIRRFRAIPQREASP